MSGKIDTREFSIEDYDATIDLWKRVGGLEICEGDEREGILKLLERNPGLSRTATDSDRVVGVALCAHDGRRGHIYHLAVDPAYQGQGIGQRLVDECMAGLRRVGIQRVIILVAGDNSRARKFWKESDWEELDGALVMGKDV